jgi:hypothetical protein
MPQPLSRVAPKSGMTIASDALAQRPQLATLMAEVISAWSYTEAILGNFLAKMLGVSAPVGIAMYSALDTFRPQMRALDAAANTAFPAEDKELYSATMTVIRRAAKGRHTFAHNVWGICNDLPDALLLVEASALWEWTPKYTEWAEGIRNDTQLTIPVAPFVNEFDNSRVFVYQAEDFLEAISRIRKAAYYVTLLAQLLPSVPAVAVAIRHLLCNEPEIRSALERNSRSRTSNFSALPQPQETTDIY